MRLFTGISLPPDVTNNLSRLLDHLRPTARVKWSAVYNLHITTKFIGEWPQDRLDELIRTLQTMPAHERIEIDVSGLGWMPNPHSPRTLFASVRAPETLPNLAKNIDLQLQSIGIPTEDRAFFPHLTLARVKEPNPLVELKRAIASLPSVDFGKFTVNAFRLFESCRGPAGTVYTQLAEFPLTEK